MVNTVTALCQTFGESERTGLLNTQNKSLQWLQ